MTAPADPDKTSAGEELPKLSVPAGETALAEQDLHKLQHDVAEAERRVDGCHSSHLVEANEQLVFAMLRAHADADAQGSGAFGAD